MKNKRFSKPCFLLLTSPVRRPEGEMWWWPEYEVGYKIIVNIVNVQT